MPDDQTNPQRVDASVELQRRINVCGAALDAFAAMLDLHIAGIRAAKRNLAASLKVPGPITRTYVFDSMGGKEQFSAGEVIALLDNYLVRLGIEVIPVTSESK